MTGTTQRTNHWPTGRTSVSQRQQAPISTYGPDRVAPPEARDRSQATAAEREDEEHVRQDADLVEQLHRVNAEEQRADQRHQRREHTAAGEIEQHGGCQAKRLLRGDDRAANRRTSRPSAGTPRGRTDRTSSETDRAKQIAVQDVLRRVVERSRSRATGCRSSRDEQRTRAPPPTITRMAIATPGRSSRPATVRRDTAPMAVRGQARRCVCSAARPAQPDGRRREQSSGRGAISSNPETRHSCLRSASSDHSVSGASGSPVQTPLHRQPVRPAVLQVLHPDRMNAPRERDDAFAKLEPVHAAIEDDRSIVDRQLRPIVRVGREAIDAGSMHDEIAGPLDGESMEESLSCARRAPSVDISRVDHVKDRRTAPAIVREVLGAQTERRNEQPRQQIASNTGKRHRGPQRGADPAASELAADAVRVVSCGCRRLEASSLHTHATLNEIGQVVKRK